MFEYRFNYNKSDSGNIEKTKLIVMVSVSNYWNKFIQNLSNFLFNTDILVIPICAHNDLDTSYTQFIQQCN